MNSNDRQRGDPGDDPDSIDPATISETSDRFGRLFNLIGDAVVEIELTDDVPVVREVNPGFEEIFGYDRETVCGESINEYIVPEGYEKEATEFDQRTAAGTPNHAFVHRKTATGVREFLYRGVPYRRTDGRQFAFAIYSDVSEVKSYERHIQVIHRILRHNLRNDLSVIFGAASAIENRSADEGVQELTEMVFRSARSLDGIGEEIRTIETVLTGDPRRGPVNLAAVCTELVQTISQEHPVASLSIDFPEPLMVQGVPQLGNAVEALVENAVVHNSGVPHVEVRGSRTGNQVVLEIADDGPGIPEHELTPLVSDTEITQLQHGSGLGLWLARYVIEACDGNIEHERTDDRTVLRVQLRPVATS